MKTNFESGMHAYRYNRYGHLVSGSGVDFESDFPVYQFFCISTATSICLEF